jgi:transcriptional regulator
MSQEMGEKDRQGIIDGFNTLGSDVGTSLAATIKERGEMKDAAKTKQ